MNITEAFERLRQQYRTRPISPTYNEAVERVRDEISQLQYTNGLQADRLRKGQETIASSRRAGQVSEEFRKQPNKCWMGSYTQRVCTKLIEIVEPFGVKGSPFSNALDAALDLLKDYHDTMHVVYEERDAARKFATEAEDRAFSNAVKLVKVERERDDATLRLRGLRDQAHEMTDLRDRLRLCQNELRDAHAIRDMFRQKVKESLKNALIESGVL